MLPGLTEFAIDDSQCSSEEKILIYEDQRFVYAARINALHLRAEISVSCLAPMADLTFSHHFPPRYSSESRD